jgi:hypothetical protein
MLQDQANAKYVDASKNNDLSLSYLRLTLCCMVLVGWLVGEASRDFCIWILQYAYGAA